MFLQENTILRPVEAEDTCTEVLTEHKKLKKKKSREQVKNSFTWKNVFQYIHAKQTRKSEH